MIGAALVVGVAGGFLLTRVGPLAPDDDGGLLPVGEDFPAPLDEAERSPVLQPAAVDAVGDTVVALILEENLGGRPQPRFVVSDDGGTGWELAEVELADPARPPFVTPTRVAGSAETGWIAVGIDDALGVMSAWTSDDGHRWSGQPPQVIEPGQVLDGVAPSGDGFVVMAGSSGDAAGDLAVWRSADGRSWEPTSVDNFSAVGFEHGGGIAVAERLDPAEVERWSADGGVTWEVVRPPVGVELDVLSGSDGLYAAGVDGAGDWALYEWVDGETWNEVGPLPARHDDWASHELLSVTHDGRVVAMGQAEDGGQVLAVSADRDWEVLGVGGVGGSGLHRPQGVASTPEATIILGEAGDRDNGVRFSRIDDDGLHDVEWTADELADPPATVLAAEQAGDTAVLVGEAGGRAAAWVRQGDDPWQGAELPRSLPRGDVELTHVAHGPAGWVAVGRARADASLAVLLSSADGTTWDELPTPARPPDALSTTPTALQANEHGYALVLTSTFRVTVREGGFATEHEEQRATVLTAPTPADLATAPPLPVGDLGNVRDASETCVPAVFDATLTALGLVAVGYPACRTTEADGTDETLGIWVQDGDGFRQAEAAISGEAAGTRPQLLGVAAQGDRVLAVSNVVRADRDGRVEVVALHSDDAGRSWSEPVTVTDSDLAMATDVLATGGGFLVVGETTGRGDVAAWRTTDGRAFQPEPLDGPGLHGDGRQWLAAAAAGERGYLLATYSEASGAVAGATWRSGRS